MINSCYFLSGPSSSCNCTTTTTSSSFNSDSEAEEDGEVSTIRTNNSAAVSASFWVRTVMRMSRARWFVFLRRVFHYQNGSRSDLGSDPFNSSSWMLMELLVVVFQLAISVYVLAISKIERPIWPMRLWIVGYNLGCALSLLLLYGRYWHLHLMRGDGVSLSNAEQQRSSEVSRTLHLLNKCRTSLELFFAIWFVMGNVWVVDSRFGSFERAPKLHLLCIFLLAWNAFCYSFPFILFLLLCCCVPLISSVLGYNMNMGSMNKGASVDEISLLPSWRYKAVEVNPSPGSQPDCNKVLPKEDPECCICLAKYRDKEEVRELPCSHIFHLKCVDKWLAIISSCPLCKQQL